MSIDHHKGIQPRDNHKEAIHNNNNSNNPTRIDNDNDPRVVQEHDHNKGIRHSNRKTNARGRAWAVVAVDGIRNSNNNSNNDR